MARSLGGATKGSDGWWHAKCPAHDDGKASLGLRDTDDGAVAWKCMAGCDKAAVGDALRARGLLPEREKQTRTTRRRTVASYDYTDASGTLVLQVVRYEPKDFRQRRPDPDKPGDWIWSLGKLVRPLYRLPELVAADPAEPVFLVEGEKDVDRLRSLGFMSTTTAQGAKAWAKSDHSPLAGRHVVIIPDNDKSGHSYVEHATGDLAGKAASLKVLELAGLPPKGDVSDWLDAGGTADELRRMAAEAPVYEPPPPVEVTAPRGSDDEDEGYERWNEQIHRNDRGEARDVIFNAALILRVDGRFAANIRYNLFLETVEARNLPWRRGGWQPWSDADDLHLAAWCQQRHAYLRPKTCADAVQIVARDVQYHPVRERLNTLVWDGNPRLESWLATYMGVVDTAYTRAVGKAWLVSAVARIMRPGVKADHILIFEGAQGIGKSTAAGALAMEDGWFADEIADLGSKDAAQDLRGKWLIELGELSALRRGEVERVKAFVSRRIDHYRPSYGKRSEDHARQCVFLGSTNSDAYLQDETGNRRFWPVKCGAVDIEGLRRDVGQIWAEAVTAYRAGAQWWLDKAVEAEARSEQDDRRIVDPWEWRVRKHIADKTEVTVTEILDDCLAIPAERQRTPEWTRAARILAAEGWKRSRARRNGSLTYIYRRPDGPAPTAQRGPFPPVPPGSPPGGNGKSSVSAPVPPVPPVPPCSDTHAPAPAYITHAHAQHFPQIGGTGGNRGNTPAPWDKLDHWRPAVARAEGNPTNRRAVARQWAMAAGATFDGFGMAVLPVELPDCLAAKDLRLLLRNTGLMPRVAFSETNVPMQPGMAS